MLLIKNQNVLATLLKRQTSKSTIDELFSKISKKKEISNKHFHNYEANIFLETFKISINSQVNIKSSGNDSLRTKFYKQLSNELFPII